MNSIPEHDMVRSLEPCMTPSQVWIPSGDFTGIVPSPDSILVRSWPRTRRVCVKPYFFLCMGIEILVTVPLAFRLGCLSTEVEFSPLGAAAGLASFASCGENILASPHGAVLMYKWNRMFSCEIKANFRTTASMGFGRMVKTHLQVVAAFIRLLDEDWLVVDISVF